jgi:hypothetical protein
MICPSAVYHRNPAARPDNENRRSVGDTQRNWTDRVFVIALTVAELALACTLRGKIYPTADSSLG